MFDYGAPTGFRLAVRHPDRITAIISQNGNAYEEGLSDGWTPIRAYWQDASPANREALRAFLKPETTVWQYTHGVPDATMVSPDGYSLDNFYLARPGADEVQLDLFGDYKSNVALYPTFQSYFRTHKPPLPGGVGQERSVLPAAGRRGVQARHSARGRPLLRHRPFRAGDPCRGDRGGHPRIPPSLTAFEIEETSTCRSQSPSSPAPARASAGRPPSASRATSRRSSWSRANRANLEETAEAVKAAGAEALVIDIDLAEPAAAQAVVDQTLAAFGRIDALLNIAGAVPQIDLFEMTDAQWESGLALKLHGARRLTIAAWPALKAAKGAVVLMSGNSALFPKAPYAAVGTINAAIVALAKAFSDRGISRWRAGQQRPARPGHDRPPPVLSRSTGRRCTT